MTDQMTGPNDSVLAPPQPADPPGTRPLTDWRGVVGKVQAVQKKLAEERAAKIKAAS